MLRVLKNWHQSVQATGCPEHLDLEFLRWLWRYPRDTRPSLDRALAEFDGQFELVQLTSPRQIRRYLERIT